MKAAYYFNRGQWWTNIYVHSIPSSVLEEIGDQLSDEGEAVREMEDPSQADYLLGCLTKRQMKVAQMLTDGYSRKEIALDVNVSLQAVHQIILRMRSRLKKKAHLPI
jgi:DNA-binding NarL/FixJ family response regulator